jgi:hypothetical protein
LPGAIAVKADRAHLELLGSWSVLRLFDCQVDPAVAQENDGKDCDVRAVGAEVLASSLHDDLAPQADYVVAGMGQGFQSGQTVPLATPAPNQFQRQVPIVAWHGGDQIASTNASPEIGGQGGVVYFVGIDMRKPVATMWQ